MPLLLQQATSSQLAALAWTDVLISGIVVAVFIVAKRRRLAMRHCWLPWLCLGIRPSLALPAFLLMRERHVHQAAEPNTDQS